MTSMDTDYAGVATCGQPESPGVSVSALSETQESVMDIETQQRLLYRVLASVEGSPGFIAALLCGADFAVGSAFGAGVFAEQCKREFPTAFELGVCVAVLMEAADEAFKPVLRKLFEEVPERIRYTSLGNVDSLTKDWA